MEADTSLTLALDTRGGEMGVFEMPIAIDRLLIGELSDNRQIHFWEGFHEVESSTACSAFSDRQNGLTCWVIWTLGVRR